MGRMLALLCVAAALGATAGMAAKPLPAVRIFALSPLQVRGAHFVAGERVKLTLRAGQKHVARTAVASRVGAFVVGFGTLTHAERCSGSISVAARGAHKDGATYSLPRLLCTTAPSGASVTYSTP